MAHRSCVMPGPDARAVQEHVVEQQGVAGPELGADDRVGPTGGVLDHLRGHRPVEQGALGAGGQDLVEALRDDVEPRGVDAAGRERQPQVERPHLPPEERAVLVPVRVGVGGHATQRALVRRQGRPFPEVRLDERGDARVLDELHQLEQHAGRVGRPQPAAGPHPTPPPPGELASARGCEGDVPG